MAPGVPKIDNFKVISIDDIADGHPVREFHQFWSANKQDGKPMAWNSFRPMEHPSVLPWVMVLDHIEDESYIYRVCGTACEQILKRNLTGEHFGVNANPDFTRQTREHFAMLRAGAEPIFTEGNIPFRDREFIRFHRACYSFADDIGRLSKIFVVMAPTSKTVRARL